MTIFQYAEEIRCAVSAATASVDGEKWELPVALARLAGMIREAHRAGKKTILIGNGGSSQIASHIAIDYSKNGGWRAAAFNDAAALTCLANDYGYEHVFAKQIEMYAMADDLVIVISSSGESYNMQLAARTAALANARRVVTFTGFKPENSLRQMGWLNFYVPSSHYGIVEITHLTLLHSIVEAHMGWEPTDPSAGRRGDLTEVARKAKTTVRKKPMAVVVARDPVDFLGA